MRWSIRALVATLLSFALSAAMLPAWAAQSPGGSGGSDQPTNGASATDGKLPSGGKLASAWKRGKTTRSADLPAFQVRLGEVEEARIGGHGVVDVQFDRQKTPGARSLKTKDAGVAINVPKGFIVQQAKGRGWACKKTQRVVRCNTRKGKVIGRSSSPADLGLRIAPKGAKAKRMVGKEATIRYSATWREQQAGKWKDRSVRAMGGLEVEPALGLTVKSASGPRMVGVRSDGGPEVRKLSLVGEVLNLHKGQVLGTWTQVSGPKVTFLDEAGKSVGKKKSVVKITKETTQTVVIPSKVTKPTKFTFELAVADRGQSLRKRVSVRVIPQTLGHFEPNTEESVSNLLGASAKARSLQDEGLQTKLSSYSDGKIGGPVILRPAAEGRTTVSFLPGSRDVRSVRWSIASGPRDLLTDAQIDGLSISFQAPSEVGTTAILVAHATLADGSFIERAKIVKFGEPDRSVKSDVEAGKTGFKGSVYRAEGEAPTLDPSESPGSSGSPSSSASGSPTGQPGNSPGTSAGPSASGGSPTPTPPLSALTESPSASASPDPSSTATAPPSANQTAFCDLLSTITAAGGDIPVNLALGEVVTLKKANTTLPAAPATCSTDGAKVGFTNATLALAGGSLSAVEGKITVDGIEISKGKLDLPQAWRQYLPGVTSIPLDIDPSAPVTASLTDGAWQAAAGDKIPLASGYNLSWLPLPGGWGFDGFTVTFGSKTIPNPAANPGGSSSSPDPSPSPSPSGSTPATIDVAAMTVEQSASADPDQGSGSVLFSVEIVNGATDSVTVTVAGIGVYTSSDGNQLQASGTGTINVSNRTGSITAGLECVDDAGDPTSCQLLKGFSLKSGSLTWSNADDSKGISFDADFEISTGAKKGLGKDHPDYEGEATHEIQASGKFTSTSDWSLTVSSPTPWQVSKNITLSGLSGSIGMTPIEPTTPGGVASSKLLIGISGAMDSEHGGEKMKITSVSADITNMCTDDAVAAGTCKVGELRIDVVIKGQIHFGDKGWKSFQVSAAFNLSTMKFEATASLSKLKFGPSNMQITDIGLTLTNDAANAGACRPKDSPLGTTTPPKGAGWALAIAAKGKAFGVDLNFGGQLTFDKQYCIWATTTEPVTVTGKVTVKDATFVYTSYPQGATVWVPQLDGGDRKQIDVPGKKFKLSGKFALQDDVASQIDTDDNQAVGGEVDIDAMLNSDLSGFEATVTYAMAKPLYLAGDANQSNLTMNKVSMRMAIGSDGLSMTFAAGLNYHTVAGPDPVEQPASDTPLFGSIEVAFNASGPSLSLAAGVDVTNGPIQNAFGQSGLTINALAIAATISAQPSISFAGSASFPHEWVKNVELKDGATISIGFVLSYTAPCIAFKLTGKASTDGIHQYDTGFDLAGMGFLTAREFTFFIAPQSCKLPIGPGQWYDVPAGFGFWFDGEILGAPVTVGFNVKLPTPTSPGFSIKATLSIPPIKMVGLTLSGATGKDQPVVVDVDIDTNAKKYYAKIDASIEIGIGSSFTLASVKIFGEFNYDPGEKDLLIRFQGSADLNFYVVKAHIDVDFTLNIDDGKLKEFGVFANFKAKIVGQEMWGGVGLYYNGDKLLTFNVYAGISFWIIIGRFSGTFDINYCRGTLTKPEQGPSQCTMDATSTKVEFLVRVYGYIKILKWRKDFNWKIVDSVTYDTATVDGDVPYATDLSMTQEGLMRLADSRGIQDYVGTRRGYAAKITGPAPASVQTPNRGEVKPCENMKSSVQFDPSNPEGDPNAKVVPQPLTCVMQGYVAFQNPGPGGSLDLWDGGKFSKVEKMTLICDKRGCAQYSPGMSERMPMYGFWTKQPDDYQGPAMVTPTNTGAGLGTNELVAAQQAFMLSAGDQINPGVMPNGYEIRSTGSYQYSMLSSPNNNCSLQVEAGNRTNELRVFCPGGRKGKPTVYWQTNAGSGDRDGNYAVMQDDGNFVFYNASGQPLWASGTSGKGNVVYLSDNGVLQVRNSSNKAIWTANSGSTSGAGSGSTFFTAGKVLKVRSSQGKCLDFNGAPKTWECNGTGSQQWTVTASGGLRDASRNVCLAVPSDSTDSGTELTMATCDDTKEAQQWIGRNTGQIMSKWNGLCVAVPDNSKDNGRVLKVVTCDDGDQSQRFFPDDLVKRGALVKLINIKTNMCLDSGNGAGRDAQIWGCNGTGPQKWTATNWNGIQNGSLCLAVEQTKKDKNQADNGNNIVLQGCNSGDSLQKFSIWGGGIRNDRTGKCLEVNKGRANNGEIIEIQDCNSNPEQKWRSQVS